MSGVAHQILMNVRQLAHVMLPHSAVWAFQKHIQAYFIETMGLKMAFGFWFCHFPMPKGQRYIDCLLYKDDAVFDSFMNAITVAFHNPTSEQCHLSQVQIGKLFGYPQETLFKEINHQTFPAPAKLSPSRGEYISGKVPLMWFSLEEVTELGGRTSNKEWGIPKQRR